MNNKVYDLKERTIRYGKLIIQLTSGAKKWNDRVIMQQILRSGTSVGANYMEADGAESKRDFRHKLLIVRKELKETLYWLELICESQYPNQVLVSSIKSETKELISIFSSIILKL